MAHSWRTMFSQPLPPTPPYTDGTYPNGIMQYPGMTSLGHDNMALRHQALATAPEEYAKQYTSRYPPATLQHGRYPDHDSQSQHQYGAPVMTHKGPILPPISTRDRPINDYRQVQLQQTKPAVPPKDEKPVGGVAQHLDYKMETMVDFVSESAQGIVNSNLAVSPSFRKYVSQVLSSTRLPSSTILYGLHYLAERMTDLSRQGRYAGGHGQIHRMLTTALLLGSKFLDDNTFQNRSWSEVSNIPVQELNTLELEWLKSIEWTLHIDFNDPHGYKLWELKWKQFQAMKTELSMEPLQLGSDLQRQSSINNKRYSQTLPYPIAYYDTGYATPAKDRLPTQWVSTRYDARYDDWSAPSSANHYSPPSAPHTGPNTPEWYGRGWYGQDFKHYNSSNVTTPASAQSFQSFYQQASYQKAYDQAYAAGNWTGHSIHCGCGYCMPHHDAYYGNFQHRSQTVAA